MNFNFPDLLDLAHDLPGWRYKWTCAICLINAKAGILLEFQLRDIANHLFVYFDTDQTPWVRCRRCKHKFHLKCYLFYCRGVACNWRLCLLFKLNCKLNQVRCDLLSQHTDRYLLCTIKTEPIYCCRSMAREKYSSKKRPPAPSSPRKWNPKQLHEGDKLNQWSPADMQAAVTE